MIVNNFSRLPYEACLIPNLPEEIKHRVRDIGNYVVRPLDMLLVVVAFVCNTLICITVARNKSLQRPSLLMLCSLSVTDMMYALFSLYLSIKTILSGHMCLYQWDLGDTAMINLSSLATLGTLAVISRDRYLAVTKPWWYRNHVTKLRAIKMSCIPWLISVVITIAVCFFTLKFDGEYKHLVYAITLGYYCICFVIIIFSHLGIYFKKPPIADISDIQAVMKRERKSAATVRLILLVLLLTFLPAFLWATILKLKGIEHVGAHRPYYFILASVNAFVNPLLNFGRNKDIRRALKGLFRCFLYMQQQHQQQQQQYQQQQQQ